MPRTPRTAVRTTKRLFVLVLAALATVGLTTGAVFALANSTSRLQTFFTTQQRQTPTPPRATPTPPRATPTPPRATPTPHNPPGKKAIVISGSATTSLAPGRSSSVPLTFTNPNNQDVVVKRVNVTVVEETTRDGVAVPGCTGSANLEVLSGYTGPDIVVPRNGSATVADPDAHGPWIRMKDTNVSQDECKGVTFGFTFSALVTNR